MSVINATYVSDYIFTIDGNKSSTASDIHDRYIISSDSLVILGHSIKDLGGSESFAVKLDKNLIADMYETVKSNFDRRWRISNTI